MIYDVSIDDKNYRLELNQVEAHWSCRVDGREIDVDAVLARPNVLSLRIGNNAYEVKCERVANEIHIGWEAVVSLLRCAIRARCAAAVVQSTSTVRGD